jgi:excinuclease UvrABC ATPase subunit
VYAADSHDLIRVHGARENNLNDVSVEIPKRRLTVFTGVSGSGKSSLVFATIAAESQRLINETYSAFLQGFMPSLSRPDVDLLEGLTTAIVVDQERMGANSRSTVGTATDANAMLRIVFSRLGVPSAGPAFHYSFNLPAGACPRYEGMGTVTDLDELFDRDRSLAQGAITIPGYTADGWQVRIFAASGFVDPEKPIRDYTEQELHDFLYKEPVKVKVESINLTYEGLVPKVQKSFLQKDKEALQPHIRAFVERAVTFTACPECGGARLNQAALASRIDGINIADTCAMQISDLAEWVSGITEPSVAPLLATLRQTLDSFVEIGLGYLRLGQQLTTLSGGERQRLKLAIQMATDGGIYVPDEPTSGLHLADVEQLLELLDQLVDAGKSVIVIEHHLAVMAHADWIIDLGPGAGHDGGRVVFEGLPADLVAARHTLTGQHLAEYIGTGASTADRVAVG